MKKTISSEISRIVTYFMLLSAWVSFLAAAWLAICLSSLSFFYGAIFWLVTTIILASMLASEHK